MTEKNKAHAIHIELEHADESLAEASLLFEWEHYNASISRSYYAAFFTARAVLLTQGIEPKSHGGAHTLFNLHFIKTGKVDKKYSRLLVNMQKNREQADYASEKKFKKEDAEKIFRHATEFFTEMRQFVYRQGFKG